MHGNEMVTINSNIIYLQITLLVQVGVIQIQNMNLSYIVLESYS